MPLGPLPSLGPFGRVVDVRVFPHGFTTQQTDTAGPAGSAIVRPNIEDAAWHAATGQKWGGNILWTGSTPRHTVAYNGPRGRWWGATKVQSGPSTVARPYLPWFAYNGARIDAPGGRNVLGAAVRVYDDLPTDQTYTGAGDGTLTVESPATAAGVLTGDYEIRCIGTAPDRFLVTGPDAVAIGVATAGVLFDGPVRFQITPGLEPFALGDTFTLTVEEAAQFIVLCMAMGGPVSGPDTAANDEIWRRPIGLGKPWRLLASLPAQTDEHFPPAQPWFLNAAGTQAVTTRALAAPAIGGAGHVRLVDLDLTTHDVTRVDQGGNAFAWTAHISTVAEGPDVWDPTYFGSATRAETTQTVTLWRDWVGDALVTCSDETTFSLAYTWDGETPSGAWYHATGTRYARTEMVITGPFAEWRRVVYEDSVACVTNNPGTTRTVSRSTVAAPVHGLAITAGGVTPLFDTEGLWTWAASGWTEIFDTTESVSVRAAGSEIAARAGGGGYNSGESSGGQQTTWVPFAYTTQSDRNPAFYLHVPDPDGGAGQSIDIDESAGGGPYIGHGDGSLLSMLGVPMAFTTAGLGYVNNRLPAVIGGTLATDSRGNYLSAVEIPTISGGYQPNLRFPMSTDTAGGRVIAGTGSGTYTDATGGPDSLTPATVASLTAHPGDDRWNIGVF